MLKLFLRNPKTEKIQILYLRRIKCADFQIVIVTDFCSVGLENIRFCFLVRLDLANLITEHVCTRSFQERVFLFFDENEMKSSNEIATGFSIPRNDNIEYRTIALSFRKQALLPRPILSFRGEATALTWESLFLSLSACVLPLKIKGAGGF